jgi:hypothetical protein
MYGYAIETLIADRQRGLREAANNHRLIAKRGSEPRVRLAHRLTDRIWAAVQQPGPFRRQSVVAPPSVAVEP